MFHFREEDHISFTNKFSAPCLGYKIDAFRGSAREHDLVSACRADVFRDALARFFVSFRRARAQRMQATMHICVLVLVITPKRVDDGAWLLRRCRAIKINQRMTMRLLAQNRKIFADDVPVYSAAGNLVHTIICSTRRFTPLYSEK